jgi:uncharacterized protein YukE
MFSTILKEVTGYFDRSALISAFFPSLIFWGTTLCLVIERSFGWKAALSTWEKLPGTAQFLILLGFFSWITFCSFLTINFQSSLIRLYEGYWPEEAWLIGIFVKQRITYHKSRWDKLKNQDTQLEVQQAAAIGYQRQLAVIENITTLSTTPSAPSTSLDEVERPLQEALYRLATVPNSATAQPSEIASYIDQLRQQWQRWAAGYPLVQHQTDNQRWQEHKQNLSKLTQQINQSVTNWRNEVEEKRHHLNRNQFLFLPLYRDDVMPTQLGNIMKAAELYSQQRYNLDAVLIWSRLQTVLPENFANILQSSKTSLDLMVTLSAFCVIFGVPLAIWLSLGADAWFLFFVPLGFALVAFLMRQWLIGGVALIGTVLGGLLSLLPSLQLTFLIWLQVFLTLLAGILVVSRLSYQSALQAALTYGEQLKAAFDLYRWKALEALNLKLPSNLTEERKLWGELCGLLYRGYLDQLSHYQYQPPANASLLESVLETAEVVVATEPLKAFQPIDPSHLKIIDWPKKQIPGDALRSINGIALLCPTAPLLTNTPLRRGQLIEYSLLSQRVIVGIPATPAMVLGGTFQTGDRVELCLHTTSGTLQTIPDVILLAMYPIEPTQPIREPVKTYLYVMVVAISEVTINIWNIRQPHKEVSVLRK